MAKEAAVREKIGEAVDFIVADDVGIEKGALLKLTDARTASGANLEDAPAAGIAAREKVSGDGRTRLAVWRTGIFDCYASGAIVVGDAVSLSEDNYVKAASVNSIVSGAVILGTALETATDAEQIQVQLNLG